MYLSLFDFESIDLTVMIIQHKFKISTFEHSYEKTDKTEMRKTSV